MPTGFPAQVGEVLDQLVRLGHSTIAKLGPCCLPGRVHVHCRKPQATLHRTLDASNAL